MGGFTDKLKKMDSKPRQVAIDPKWNTITCQCGNTVFTKGVILKEVPKGIINKKINQLSPTDILYCAKCGTLAPGYENIYWAVIEKPKVESTETEPVTS